MRGGAWRWLLPLFAASGCAALIYEIVWFQMLQLVIGSTAVSLGMLLATFMGGLCLGSLALLRVAPNSVHPLRLWAILELGTGVLGIAVFYLVPWLSKLYAAVVPAGLPGLLLRGVLSSICLVPPTFLMGATLPAIAPLISRNSRGASKLGLLYAANTSGAFLGALLTGFVVLRFFNSTSATFLAAGINFGCALIAAGFAPLASMEFRAEPAAEKMRLTGNLWAVILTISLSGFCALGAEIVWTRLLSLLLGSTTYAFSIILAIFLLGLAIGSGLGSLVVRRSKVPSRLLGLCQWLVIAAIAWSAFLLNKSLPFWPINPGLARNIWYIFQLDLLRTAWAIFPATLLWGASFPIALAAAMKTTPQAKVLVARLYAANTAGAIVGALSVSIVVITWLGTQQAQRLLMLVTAFSGLVMYFSATHSPALPNRALETGTRSTRLLRQITLLAGAATCTALLLWSVPPVPWPLIAYGRYLPQKTELGSALYVGEGMNSSVAVSELPSGIRNFHVSGKIEASTDQQDMRLQRMLAHIPALFHPDPRSILVVGCGAGVTAGSFLTHPGTEKITLCEIEPMIPRIVARYFGEENYDVVEDPRVHIIYDDARHFVLATRETFDVITSDPIHPYVKGAAALYTREYFELCKRHLKHGGLVTQWVPLYESDLATVKSEIATFFTVFPEGTIWSNEDMGAGYDLVLLGQVEPLEVDVETIQRRLNRTDHARVLQSLRDVGVRSAFSLAATYAGRARDLQPWLGNAQLNRDSDLRLQYLAGLALNHNEPDDIYTSLCNYRQFPEDIFVGANTWNDSLRRALAQPKPKEPSTPPSKSISKPVKRSP